MAYLSSAAVNAIGGSIRHLLPACDLFGYVWIVETGKLMTCSGTSFIDRSVKIKPYGSIELSPQPVADVHRPSSGERPIL